VSAVIKGSMKPNDNIKYYFISDNKLAGSIYEFELKNSSSGEIIIRQLLNRNVSKIREVF
jgi:hypothetical protein